MIYIISSIGRSGSTLITDVIAQATGQKIAFATSFKPAEEGVLKMHAHFRGEPGYEYRAIFIYSKNVEDVIASMFSPLLDLKKHLVHLEVSKKHRAVFWTIVKVGKLFGKKAAKVAKQAAFRYLIKGDKLRFRENMLSWKSAQHVLFVAYEDLCGSKERELARISGFLGISLPDFVVRQRQTKDYGVPVNLRW